VRLVHGADVTAGGKKKKKPFGSRPPSEPGLLWRAAGDRPEAAIAHGIGSERVFLAFASIRLTYVVFKGFFLEPAGLISSAI